MATLSSTQSEAADLVLCTDSKELPCHSRLELGFPSVARTGTTGNQAKRGQQDSYSFQGRFPDCREIPAVLLLS